MVTTTAANLEDPARQRVGESRPVSRVLSRAVIPLGSPSPWTSSGLPGSARGSALRRPLLKDRRGFPIWPCSRWGLPCRRVLPPTRCALTAPFHPCRSREGLGRSALCCTFRGLAPPRRYLAPDPPEPGLSSTRAIAGEGSDCPADSRGHDTGACAEVKCPCGGAGSAPTTPNP